MVAIGPHRACDGLYLLLPPGYAGHVPEGYYAFESSTYNVFLFFRPVMAPGEGGLDPAPAVELVEQTRIYPLWTQQKDIPPMEFPNASGQRVDMMYPVDNAYWTKLKKFADYEPVTSIDPELRGVFASIGIVKGRPFAPTKRQQELLLKAVETAPRMSWPRVSSASPTGVTSTTTIDSTNAPGPAPRPRSCRRTISTSTSTRVFSSTPILRPRRW